MTLARTFSRFFNGGLALLVVAAALPGPHRVAMARGYGLTEIAPRIWTDSPAQSAEFLSLIAAAETRVATFFGDEPSNPTMVLCTTQTCAKAFGIRGNGLSVADITVMVAPGGLTLGTLTHELTHSRLHRRMGLRNIWAQPFPTWFDEGLATHVASHPNWQGSVSAEARSRIRNVVRFWQWRPASRELGVGRAYSAAATEVAAIEAELGRDGLLSLIARAEAGERFDATLTSLLVKANQ